MCDPEKQKGTAWVPLYLNKQGKDKEKEEEKRNMKKKHTDVYDALHKNKATEQEPHPLQLSFLQKFLLENLPAFIRYSILHSSLDTSYIIPGRTKKTKRNITSWMKGYQRRCFISKKYSQRRLPMDAM